MTCTRQYQADRPSPHHRSSAEPTQAARYHPFRLPPRSPCRRAGRDDTVSKQRRHMITPSRRHPSASSHPPPHRQAEADNRTGNRDRHGTPHIGTVPDSKQARQNTQRPRLPAPRSEQARSMNGTRWVISQAHVATTNTGKQADSHPPPHRLPDETNGTEERADNLTATRGEQAGRGTERDEQERTETHEIGR